MQKQSGPLRLRNGTTPDTLRDSRELPVPIDNGSHQLQSEFEMEHRNARCKSGRRCRSVCAPEPKSQHHVYLLTPEQNGFETRRFDYRQWIRSGAEKSTPRVLTDSGAELCGAIGSSCTRPTDLAGGHSSGSRNRFRRRPGRLGICDVTSPEVSARAKPGVHRARRPRDVDRFRTVRRTDELTLRT